MKYFIENHEPLNLNDLMDGSLRHKACDVRCAGGAEGEPEGHMSIAELNSLCVVFNWCLLAVAWFPGLRLMGCIQTNGSME